MRRFASTFVIAAQLLLVGGCDFLANEKDGTIIVAGTVVLAETGIPIQNLGVSLGENGSFGGLFIRATANTGTDGSFRIIYDAGPNVRLHTVTVNDEPYNPRFTVSGGSARPGEVTDLGVIELGEN